MNAPTLRLRITLTTGLVLFVTAVAIVVAVRPASAALPVVPPTQEVAALLRSHQAFAKPDLHSRVVETVSVRRPITNAQTVLPVIAHATDAADIPWLRVRLAGRPNGLTGWIRQRATVTSLTSWHVGVDISSRQVIVYRYGRVVRMFTAIVGKPATPTPRGNYFVEEAVDLPAGAAGAPFALALSARSYVLQEFAGGPGQVAIHGLANVGGVLGTAVSHGCIRVDTAAIRWLVARIGPGTPVTVTS